MNRKVIVFGGNHHNTLGVVRSLGEKGIRSDILIEQDGPSFVEKSRYVNKRLNPNKNIIDFLVEAYHNEEEKPVLFCTSDSSIELIDSNYNLLKSYFYCFNAGVEGRISFYLNKNEMQDLAIKSGLTCPKSWLLSSNTKIPEDIIFPCIAKPLNSTDGVKADITICNTKEELKVALSKNIIYQVQELIEKDFELNLTALSINHGNNLIIPGIIRKIREFPIKKGMTSLSVLEPCSKYPFINIDLIKEFVKMIGFEGLLSVEFVVKGQTGYFLEINMRNDGNGYAPTCAGINLPYLWYQYACNKKIDVNQKSSCLPLYIMCEYVDFWYFVKKYISFKSWLHDVKMTKCFLLYNSKDLKPFFNFTIRRIAHKLGLSKVAV